MRANKILQEEHFGIQRKIIATMTTESWRTIPHAGVNYEPDVTNFWETYTTLRNESNSPWAGITANVLILYVILQGLKACPAMNGHISFRRKSASGHVTTLKNIDLSVPMTLPVGGMTTITLRDCEPMCLQELADAFVDIRRRMERTNFEEVLMEAAMENTLGLLRQGRLDVILARLLGTSFGKGKTQRLRGAARKAYHALPQTERLTKDDITQGSITVSNFGSLYRASYAPSLLLEIIPPQISVIGIGPLTERPGCVQTPSGTEILPRTFLPLALLFDHRALDYGDLTPFMTHLDELFAHPERLSSWL